MGQLILLVEDDESLRRGIALKLQKEGYQVQTAGSAHAARKWCAAQTADLVICDVLLPDGSGLELCREIGRRSEGLFLFLTAMDTEVDIVNGYDAGADDYMTKPFSLMVLVSKVHAMLKRVSADQEVICSGEITLYPRERRALKNGRQLALSANEYKLLSTFMQHPLAILSHNQLLDCLWDWDSDYADRNAVAVNIRRLREKIEQNASSPVYIKNVRGMGYVWDEECVKR